MKVRIYENETSSRIFLSLIAKTRGDRISSNKKQSEERTANFAVRVHVIYTLFATSIFVAPFWNS